MKIIPFNPKISSKPVFSVNLGDLVCEFSFSFNERVQAWFCDFVTTSGANYSVRLVEWSPLLGKINRTGLDGDFRVLKYNKLGLDTITYDNFGTDWKLVFLTEEEGKVIDGVQS